MGLRRPATTLVLALLSASACGLLAVSHASGSPEPAAVAEETEQHARLRAVLATMARVAEFYYDQALSFSCHETVHYRIMYPGGKSLKSDGKLFYEYLFVKNEHDLPVEKRHKRAGSSLGPRSVRRLLSLGERMYFWIALFSRELQPYYGFEIVDVETAKDPEAIRIRFSPRERDFGGMEAWQGTALVDLDSYQIIEIEAATREHFLSRERIDELLRPETALPTDPRDRTYLVFRVITEMTEVKNGMRFPSKAEVRMERHIIKETMTGDRVDSPDRLMYVRQRYKDYVFAEVSTYEKFRDFVFRSDTARDEPE